LIERSKDGVIDKKRYKYNPATGGLERIEDAKDPEEKKTDQKKTDDSTPQPAKPEEKKEKSSGSGLKTEEIPTQYGKVVFQLPDDLAAGDTISGTVTAVPFGGTDRRTQSKSWRAQWLCRPGPTGKVAARQCCNSHHSSWLREHLIIASRSPR